MQWLLQMIVTRDLGFYGLQQRSYSTKYSSAPNDEGALDVLRAPSRNETHDLTISWRSSITMCLAFDRHDARPHDDMGEWHDTWRDCRCRAVEQRF